jgi:membrane protein
MRPRIERLRSGLQAVLREVRREDVTFMAASIAYHAFISMLPILLLLTLAVSVLGGEQFETTVVQLTAAVLPGPGRRVLTDTIRDASASVGLSVAFLGVLLWGTSKIFRAMDAAFAELYDTERNLSLVDQFRDAIVVLVALAAATAGLIAVGSVVEIPAAVPFPWVLEGLLGVLGLAVAFLPIYYVFPDVDVSVREVVPGVLVAATGWMVLKWVFNLYVGVSSKPDVYGLIGTLVLLVTWLYVGGLLLLLGASVNSTLAGRGGNLTGRRRGKRRFGRQISDVESLEERLGDLVTRARDADLSDGEIQRALRTSAGRLGAPRDEQHDATATADSAGHSSDRSE